jgi:hypothetical protein
MNSCSAGNSIEGWDICFSSVIVSVVVPYSCLLLRMWRAYVDCGSLCFMYRVCSLNHCCRVRLV